MTASDTIGVGTGGGRIGSWLLALALLLGASFTAQAEDCSDYPGGVLDGAAGTPAPSQLNIDQNCTIRNYPASNPLPTNFSFFTSPGQTNQRWLVVFDNVVHTGQMSCNAVLEHRIWFVNGSSTAIKDGCQNLLIPVEKIDKQTPAGQTTATIGVPFTYRLTMPVLFAPATRYCAT
jgi:large repetitive protein